MSLDELLLLPGIKKWLAEMKYDQIDVRNIVIRCTNAGLFEKDMFEVHIEFRGYLVERLKHFSYAELYEEIVKPIRPDRELAYDL